MDFNLIPAGAEPPKEVNAVIEIPAQSSPVKYEADKQLGLLRVDRIMSAYCRVPFGALQSIAIRSSSSSR